MFVVIEERVGVEQDLVEEKDNCVAHKHKSLRQGENFLLALFLLRPRLNLLRQDVDQTDGEEDAAGEGVRDSQNFGAASTAGRPGGYQTRNQSFEEGHDDEADLRDQHCIRHVSLLLCFTD